MLEESVEARLISLVTRRGGVCIKLSPKGYKGIPDRLVVLPGGRIMFVELKRPKGGVVSGLQSWWHDTLKRLGAEVHVASTLGAVEALFTA